MIFVTILSMQNSTKNSGKTVPKTVAKLARKPWPTTVAKTVAKTLAEGALIRLLKGFKKVRIKKHIFENKHVKIKI